MTLQRRDILTYNDERYALNCDILKSYFQTHPASEPEKTGFDSNLHRGYFAEFEIIGNQLLVVDVSVMVDLDISTGEEISKSVVESTLSNRRLCQWFSGVLILFSLSDRPEYLRLKIKEGMVTEMEVLTKQEYNDLGNHAYDYF